MTEYYSSKKSEHEKELKHTQTRLNLLSGLRLAIFCITFVLIYVFRSNTDIIITSLILGSVSFVFLLNRYLKLNQKKQLLLKLIAINTTEIYYINGDYFDYDTGNEFIDPTHFYSYDIDLFGKGSFFQFINRTATKQGKSNLSTILTNNNINDVNQKQEVIEELSEKSDWRQLFSATASLIEVKNSVNSILDWIENYKSILSKRATLISNVFSIITLVIATAAYFNIIVVNFLFVWFFIGLVISGIHLKRVNQIHNKATQTTATFNQYYKLLELIENEKFISNSLEQEKQKLHQEKQKASDIFKAFSKILDALDQRSNIVVAVVRNGFFLSDMKQASKIEAWIDTNKNTTRTWFDVISFFDAQNSLANFKFNHSDFIFPEITNNNLIAKATNLGHPLINKTKRITNNYSINSEGFFIITGSNMAGKSTFLRTVALNMLMANIGLPICASTMKYKPIKLITSMRTADSLTDNTSYFFAEIKRLKFIINTINTEPYFILLDEILKGTNSVDKANGSKKFVEKLIKSKTTGIIATHDLSLCSITETYSNIENYYFDSEIINNELVFDYKLKDGICKNMNASFLLKKMEII